MSHTLRHQLYAVLAIGLAVGAAPATADLFTVGSGGTHSTIQAAVDAALAVGGSSEIRVLAGTTFHERVRIFDLSLRSLDISGNWMPGFLSQSSAPTSTVIDADGDGRPFALDCQSGRLRMADLILTGGMGGIGGGARVAAIGDCSVRWNGIVVVGNRAEGIDFAGGGGLHASLHQRASMIIRSCRFESNFVATQIVRGATSVSGGGAWVLARGTAELSLLDSEFIDNEVAIGSRNMGGGLRIAVGEQATARVLDNVIRGNRVNRFAGSIDSFGSGAFLRDLGVFCDRCQIEFRRNRVLDNRGADSQLRVQGHGSLVQVSDSVIAGGDQSGLIAQSENRMRVLLTNLTVTDHLGNGVSAQQNDGSSIRLSNNILFGNGVDLELLGVPASATSANLVGENPLFVDAAAGDYRVLLASPALDAGDDHAPGLGTLDVAGRPRLLGAHVDIGAHEAESGSRGSTSLPCRASAIPGFPNPVPDLAPLCRCLEDPGHGVHRCAFFVPDLFLTAEVPVPLPPFSQHVIGWTIQPWSGVEGLWSIEAAVFDQGQWVPAQAVAPQQGNLAANQLDQIVVMGATPAVPASMVTEFRYWPSGSNTPRGWRLELLLPVE